MVYHSVEAEGCPDYDALMVTLIKLEKKKSYRYFSSARADFSNPLRPTKYSRPWEQCYPFKIQALRGLMKRCAYE